MSTPNNLNSRKRKYSESTAPDPRYNTSAQEAGSFIKNENLEAMKILYTQGEDEAIKFMTNPTGENPLTYSEMRARFG